MSNQPLTFGQAADVFARVETSGEDGSSRYWMENFDFAKGEFKERPPEEITVGERFWRAASDSKLDEVRAQTAERHSRGTISDLQDGLCDRSRTAWERGWVGLECLPLLLAPVSSFPHTSKASLTACCLSPPGPSAG